MALTSDDLQAIAGLMQDIIGPLQNEIDAIHKDISDIKMTQENVTNHNIKIIAEGHLDLNRKLNEALHIANDIKAKQEMQDILVSDHTNKLKQII